MALCKEMGYGKMKKGKSMWVDGRITKQTVRASMRHKEAIIKVNMNKFRPF